MRLVQRNSTSSLRCEFVAKLNLGDQLTVRSEWCHQDISLRNCLAELGVLSELKLRTEGTLPRRAPQDV